MSDQYVSMSAQYENHPYQDKGWESFYSCCIPL